MCVAHPARSVPALNLSHLPDAGVPDQQQLQHRVGHRNPRQNYRHLPLRTSSACNSALTCSFSAPRPDHARTTGVSKGFGFAQFTSTEHARAFVDPLFPFIQVPPPASHGATATAAFYRALEGGNPAPPGGRRIKIDYSQSAAPGERRAKGPFQTNDGTRDIGNTQAPILLFRGLDPLSGPQAIAQAMRSSSGIGKIGAKGMRRIVLIKDKSTNNSWGFAFVEFVDVQVSKPPF